MSKPAFLQTAAALLIFLFLYTGLDKLVAHKTFFLTVGGSPLLGGWAGILSWFIPVLEIMAALLLAVPFLRLPGFLLSSVLMMAFTLYVGYMVLFIPDLPCNCGGIVSSLTWGQHLILNIFFLCLSLAATFLSFIGGKVGGDK